MVAGCEIKRGMSTDPEDFGMRNRECAVMPLAGRANASGMQEIKSQFLKS